MQRGKKNTQNRPSDYIVGPPNDEDNSVRPSDIAYLYRAT